MNTIEFSDDLGIPQSQMEQLGPLLQSYAAAADTMSNAELYESLSSKAVAGKATWDKRTPIGKSGALHSLEARKTRWYQQNAKLLGLIEPVPGQRGIWRATEKLRTSKKLTPAAPGFVTVAYSTRLGIALWANAEDVFKNLDEPIHLYASSPPYLLRKARAYGGGPTDAREYVDFICLSLEPIMKNLAPGASVVLNVSNDCFEPGSPARSSYRERLVVALEDRYSMYKMDTLIWVDQTKAPGPLQWASKERKQLNVGWEPIYVFCRQPLLSRANNLRVLRTHTETHQKYIQQGGAKQAATYGDGANRLKVGAFSNPTPGAIPRNVLVVPHKCPSQISMRKELKRRGLPIHSATMPLEIASFLVRYLTNRGDYVVDDYSGWNTMGLAAELNGCRWLTTERVLEYVGGSQLRFEGIDGFESYIDIPD